MSDLGQKIKQAEQRAADRKRALARQYASFEATFAKRADTAKKIFAALAAAWTLTSLLRMRRKAVPAATAATATARKSLFARLAGLITLLIPLLRFTPYRGLAPVLRLLSAGKR